MSSNAPWSVKGIDPKSRETAKELARRSGMTLGEWLNARIREEGGAILEARTNTMSNAMEELTARIEAAEQRATLAVSGVDQSVRGLLTRLETAEREQVAVGARFEGAIEEARSAQANLDQRLRRLEDEAAGPRSAEALKSLEAALGRVANHLYDGEGRTRESIADLRRDMGSLAARLEKAEEALAEGRHGGSEDIAASLNARLDAAEARLDEKIRRIEGQVASAISRPDAAAEIEKKLDTVAANLARGLQAVRAEMNKQLREAMQGSADRLDQAMVDMAAHVQAAEQRSAEALERMGQEVLRVAEVLNRRVGGVESRTASAIQAIGGDVARAVDTLEGRIDRSETAQAESIEALGVEITRAAERLTERIGVAERRGAQAVDDVQDKLALAVERLNQRHERLNGDLAERIRQSEERTQRLLEEARERIERRMAERARERAALAPPPAPAAPARSPFAEPASFADPYDPPAYPARAERAIPQSAALYPDAAPFGQRPEPLAAEPEFDEADIEAADDFGQTASPETEADFVEDDPFLEADLDDEPLIAADALDEDDADAPEEIEARRVEFEAADEPAPLDLSAPAGPESAPPPPSSTDISIAPKILTTRELVEQARAAARAASKEAKAKEKQAKKAKAREKAAPIAGGSEALGSISFSTTRDKASGARAAMMMTFGGAAVLLGASGIALFGTPAGEKLMSGVFKPDGAAEDATAPRAAVALNPEPIDKPDPAAPLPAGERVPDPEAASLFAQGRKLLAGGDIAGLELVRKAANLGQPEAQTYLGSLYEAGSHGLAKDDIEARRWYERAGRGGDPRGMHSIAMLMYEGRGGPQNYAGAAEWFKRAAELGFVDSQFNIAELYRMGQGITENASEAYKWYLLAARGGSPEQRAEARAAADRIKVTLPADERMTAERIAADFAARGSAAPVQVTAPEWSVLDAQRVLKRLGYYKGEANGTPSMTLRSAIQEFQRDQGLVQSGQLDTLTALRLEPYLR